VALPATGDACKNAAVFLPRQQRKNVKDDWGGHFLATADAMAHAAKIAKELAEDVGWGGYLVVVEVENGTEIGRVPVRR
jgi:hypothetical protein